MTAALRFRGVVWSWELELWLAQSYVGKKHYRKMTELAAQIFHRLPDFAGLNVHVFDAFYLCPPVTEASAARGWHWFSVASRNRTFKPDKGRRRQLRDCFAQFLPASSAA